MRSSGILMPLFSLPTAYGIGSLGKEAYNFIDFLAESGQVYWQMLPSGPTSYGDSPYQSFSAFATNPYFIDLEKLAEDGLLTEEELKEERVRNTPGTIDYERLYNTRFKLLRKATDRIKAESSRDEKIKEYRRGFGQFKSENSFWLEEYALFMAIKTENGDVCFKEWPDKLRYRDEKALAEAKERLITEIYFWSMLQYMYFVQHRQLKAYANFKGIKLIGDIPIYVSPDSAEIWAQSELFLVDDLGNQTVQAGCPPDAFSETGQLWGNPIYDWKANAETGYNWWIRRMQHAYKLFDVVRIDHFRGFTGYYTIPADKKDAIDGKWEKGPGGDFIKAIKGSVPQAQTEIIAEDLGFLTQDVHDLLKMSGFPGMKILQFAFDSGEDNIYLPHKYEENCVVYTGTHDNTTIVDWAITAAESTLEFAKKYLKEYLQANYSMEKQKVIVEDSSINEAKSLAANLIAAALASKASTAIIPMADWLALGAEARINTPGTLGGNWQWRLKDGIRSEGSLFTRELAAHIREMTKKYAR